MLSRKIFLLVREKLNRKYHLSPKFIPSRVWCAFTRGWDAHQRDSGRDSQEARRGRRLVKGRYSQTGALGRRRSEVSNERRGGRRKGRRCRRSASAYAHADADADADVDGRSSTTSKGQVLFSSSSSMSSDDSDEELIRAVDKLGIWAEQAKELRRCLWALQQSGKE